MLIDFGYVINTTRVELVFLHLDDLHAIVSIEDRVQRSPVPFVRHSTAIIALACTREIDRLQTKNTFDKLIFKIPVKYFNAVN